MAVPGKVLPSSTVQLLFFDVRLLLNWNKVQQQSRGGGKRKVNQERNSDGLVGCVWDAASARMLKTPEIWSTVCIEDSV